MARTISPFAYRAAQSLTTGDAFFALLTVTAGAETVRMVNNIEPIVSRGLTFEAWPFELSLPDDTDYTVSAAQITIDNVDPRIWSTIRTLADAPTFRIEVVLLSVPDDVMFTVDNLRLREAKANSVTIDGSLSVDNVWQSSWPIDDFSPSQYPGLFQI